MEDQGCPSQASVTTNRGQGCKSSWTLLGQALLQLSGRFLMSSWAQAICLNTLWLRTGTVILRDLTQDPGINYCFLGSRDS